MAKEGDGGGKKREISRYFNNALRRIETEGSLPRFVPGRGNEETRNNWSFVCNRCIPMDTAVSVFPAVSMRDFRRWKGGSLGMNGLVYPLTGRGVGGG